METSLRRSLPPLLLMLTLLASTRRGATEELQEHHDCTLMTPGPCAGITGLRQSPIYIDTCDEFETVRRPLRISHLDSVPQRMRVENFANVVLGDTVWRSGEQPTIRGGGLPGEFAFELLELHWGTNSSSGSEHVVDDRRYAGELHLGLRNVRYSTVEEALGKVDGFLGLAIFLDEEAHSPGRGITSLAPALFQIEEADSTANLPSPPSLRELLPIDLNRYVRYTGSGTTGDCPESTIWIVFLEPIRVLPLELETLRSLRGSDGGRLCSSSLRPLQPLSGRRLYRRGGAPVCQEGPQ